MNGMSDLVVMVVDVVVYLGQQAAVAALAWAEEVSKLSGGLRHAVSKAMVGQADPATALDTTEVAPATSHLHRMLIMFASLWHYARRAVRSLLVAMTCHIYVKIALARCFLKLSQIKPRYTRFYYCCPILPAARLSLPR